MKILVKVKTRAKEERVQKIGENSFLVAIKEPPEKGRANAAVIKALAKHFYLPIAKARIISGSRSRQKIVEIDN